MRTENNGPFVYRSGRQVFILETGVRFPYGLQVLEIMANHKSAIKRIRSNETKRLRNRYQHKSARTAIRNLRSTTDKKAAQELLPQVIKMLDRLAKTNIIHKNKAGNLKSSLMKHVNSL